MSEGTSIVPEKRQLKLRSVSFDKNKDAVIEMDGKGDVDTVVYRIPMQAGIGLIGLVDQFFEMTVTLTHQPGQRYFKDGN